VFDLQFSEKEKKMFLFIMELSQGKKANNDRFWNRLDSLGFIAIKKRIGRDES
jgi:hypothetical protein